MTGTFLAVAAANAFVVAMVTWALGRRFGARACLLVPVIGLAAAGVMTWRNTAPGDAGLNLEVMSTAVVITSPWLVGALVGLILTVLRPRY